MPQPLSDAQPSIAPRNLREALVAATALRDAAKHMDVHHPMPARVLRQRADRIVQAQLAQDDARWRWCRRPVKCGPSTQPGPGHITVPGGIAKTTDMNHRTLCGKNLTGRIEFGPSATAIPEGLQAWRTCPACVAELERLNSAPVPAPVAAVRGSAA